MPADETGDSDCHPSSSVGLIVSMALLWLYCIYGHRQRLKMTPPPRLIWSTSTKSWIGCSRRSRSCVGSGTVFVPHSSMQASHCGHNGLLAMPRGPKPSPKGSASNQCVRPLGLGESRTSRTEELPPKSRVSPLPGDLGRSFGQTRRLIPDVSRRDTGKARLGTDDRPLLGSSPVALPSRQWEGSRQLR